VGLYEVKIVIRGTRSAHNSLQDKLDTAKWEYIAEEIKRLLERDDYESLNITVEGPIE